MKPTQKELDDFVLDLAELLGKHFSGYFDKTKIAGGNQGISLFFRLAASGSELEIATDGCQAAFRIGAAGWRPSVLAAEGMGKQRIFSAIISDLMAVLENRLYPVYGYRGGKQVGGIVYSGIAEAEAAADFRARFPGCERITVKKWTETERDLLP
ncbi:MAG: hypothetical protein ABI036_17645 [Fibrobacteria bacterium]